MLHIKKQLNGIIDESINNEYVYVQLLYLFLYDTETDELNPELPEFVWLNAILVDRLYARLLKSPVTLFS